MMFEKTWSEKLSSAVLALCGLCVANQSVTAAVVPTGGGVRAG